MIVVEYSRGRMLINKLRRISRTRPAVSAVIFLRSLARSLEEDSGRNARQFARVALAPLISPCNRCANDSFFKRCTRRGVRGQIFLPSLFEQIGKSDGGRGARNHFARDSFGDAKRARRVNRLSSSSEAQKSPAHRGSILSPRRFFVRTRRRLSLIDLIQIQVPRERVAGTC